MAAKIAKRKPKKKGGYQMPETIPAGEILTDISKKQWILGKSIGVGGFGEVYSAAPYSKTMPKDYPNVIKIEPHENGPLFVEMHFYLKNCKPDDIDSWRKKKKFVTFGMPRYVGSGSHEYKNTKYRFLVIDRYGKDLYKIFEENNKQFPEHIVYKLALQIIDILEYIHHKNYVHADIKSENLLLDLKTYDQVYLVDFGLASRCTTSTVLKVDPKKAHNGTLQYTSRDAHMGVPTQRGDIEILSYNMIWWLCGSLPWEKLTDCITVQKEKEKAFENIGYFLDKCFHGSVPQAVHKFMTLLAKMKFNEVPCYEKFKDILINVLQKQGYQPDGKLGLKNIGTTNKQNSSKVKTPQKTKVVNKIKKSPEHITAANSARHNPRDSTVGIVIDKKRGNKKDIKKVLDNIDPDGEYDIKIVQKTKRTKSSGKESETVENEIPLNNRKKIKLDYAENDIEIKVINQFKKEPLSKRLKTPPRKPTTTKTRRKLMSLNDSDTCEPEIVSRGTKSRPVVNFGEKVRLRNTDKTLQFDKIMCSESQSDEDMFDM